MYMYYLLGYKNLSDVELSDQPKSQCKKHQPTAEIFQRMPESAITKVTTNLVKNHMSNYIVFYWQE